MNNMRFVANTFFAILCATLINTKSFAEPVNLNTVKDNLRAYHDSGDYQKEITKVATQADQYMVHQAEMNERSKHPQKLAIVLDIDETSLSYYDHMYKRHFTHDPIASREEILTENAPAIKPILLLYQNALSHHIAVFFITARRSFAYQATVRNLKAAGYRKWAGLYTRPNYYKEPSMAPFKSETRAMIMKQGYTIIASIGDQLSDLSGGHAQKMFKLPNPYYFIP
ncbi:MAG: HAD family acid phosphatase [Legionellaceae bacterium]|nr:HAD family acid phosphatase [Legionellaceae bacterium]